MVKQDGGLIVLRVLAAARSRDISMRTRKFLLFLCLRSRVRCARNNGCAAGVFTTVMLLFMS